MKAVLNVIKNWSSEMDGNVCKKFDVMLINKN